MIGLLRRIPFSLVWVIIVGLLFKDYWVFLNDDASPLKQKITEIERADAFIVQMRQKVLDAEQFYRALDVKRAEVRALAQELIHMREELSDDIDVPSFLRMLATEGKRVGVRILSLKPAGVEKKELFFEHTFDLNFRAVFAQVVVYLQRLGATKRIIRADGITLKPVADPRSRYVELEGTIKLKAYRYAQSEADAKAQSVGGGL